MVYLKTKNCPFCGKEISDEAIICKFCHRLLIDENGNDILPEGEEPAAAEETAVTEDKTIVYKKEDLQKLLNKQDYEEAPADEEPEEDDAAETIVDDGDEDFVEEEDFGKGAAVSSDDGEAEEDDDFPTDDDNSGNEADDDDFGGDDGYEYENEPAPMPRRAPRRDDRYDDPDLADSADYDPKRTFIVTAIVTLGILLIIVVAILVGYKLFGSGSGSEETGTKKVPVASTSSAADSTQSAAGAAADTSAAADSGFVPSVVNDTLSENPEEIVNSAASDPVIDSAATTPEATTTSSLAASTDSGVNIVIRPDPNADNSTADSTATDDSRQPGDGPSSTDSNTTPAEPAGPGAPSFEAAGSYYSWSEAETLMANYASANNLGSNYSYYGGTDGVEMLYAFYDDYGNATVYRVDLQTGYVSAS